MSASPTEARLQIRSINHANNVRLVAYGLIVVTLVVAGSLWIMDRWIGHIQ